jgi:hypothetical protein
LDRFRDLVLVEIERDWLARVAKTYAGVPYFGNQDDGQNVAEDTDDMDGYGDDENLTMLAPTGESEEGL